MERKCIVERESKPRNSLLRFVLGPSGMDDNKSDLPLVIPDLKEKLPGRGVWVTCDRTCVATAVEKKLFARAFKTRCHIPDGLPDQVDALLENRCLNILSLAKKAGHITTGFDKVHAAMSKTTLDVLIEATDGAEGGQIKLEKKFSATFPEGKIIKLFTSGQMDMAFGGTNVIHAAITHGNMTQNILAAIDKLAKYRGKATGFM